MKVNFKNINKIPKRFTEYAEDVLSGKIIACQNIILACQRYLDWLDRKDFWFNQDLADKILDFFAHLKHFDDDYAGKPFLLSDWQRFCVFNIFCFFRADDHEARIIHNAVMMISRKNGKTAFAAGMMLADLLICSKGVFSSYLIANTRDQAKTIFRFVKGFVHSLDPKQKKIRVYRDYITIKKKGTAIESIVKVLSADSSKLDGLGPDSFILDEQGAAPNFDNFNILKSGQGAKKNPLSITISSAGFLVGEQYPLYQNVQVGSKVLRGDLQDDTSFYALYQLDDESEWQDERCWKKCCPNYGVTVSKAFMEERINEANNFGGSKLTDVKTKNFNIFCDSAEVWIQQEFLQKCHAKIPLDALKGTVAYVGVDLSATRDLTAIAICFPPDEYREFYPDRYLFKTWAWIPKWAVNNSRNKKMYQWFIQNKYAEMTAGNSVDYDAVLKKVKELSEKFCIAGLMFDPWNSSQFIQNCSAEGFCTCIPVSQSIGSMSRSVKTLEINILAEKVILEMNPLLTWCFANCVLKTDYNGNQKPVKSDDDVKKIDPVIAILNALMGPLLEQLGGDYGVIDLPFTNQST